MNIIGRLTRDAQVRTTKEGKQLVAFSVAVNDSYRNGEGQQVQLTDYYDCAYWRTVKVAGWLTKGTLVELDGRVTARAWSDGDGAIRAGLNLFTRNIRFLAGGRAGAEGQPAEKDHREGSSKGSAGKAAKQQQEEGGDDLPF